MVGRSNDCQENDCGPLFFELALACAVDLWITDYRGGCNGTRIRFPESLDREGNESLDEVVDQLRPVYEEFAENGLT